jgi:hypothetical protein
MRELGCDSNEVGAKSRLILTRTDMDVRPGMSLMSADQACNLSYPQSCWLRANGCINCQRAVVRLQQKRWHNFNEKSS